MKIIVTGMHRSGTSMVAGLLKLCGAYLGDNLISGLRDNPRGHFEDRDFVAINDYILRKNNGSWRRPPQTITAVPVPRMRKFLSQWPTDRIVALKDPRACFTLGVWRQLIHDQNLKIIFVSRSSYEIADSLAARNKIPHAESLALVRKYVDAFRDNTKNARIIATSYASYFGDGPIPWRGELKRVCKFADLKIPDDIATIENFIDPNLRHFDHAL